MTDTNSTRIALVTGGANGIGKRIAEVLGRAGCKLAIWDIDQDALDKLVAELQRQDIPALGMTADITDAEKVKAALGQLAEKWDTPDILVNNAGITRDALLMRLSEADWDAVLSVNLKAAFLLIKACLRPMLKKRWGRIINIASVVGLMGNAGQANYAASKAGLIGLTMSVAREAASRNVTVNAIAPGFIDTAMTRNLPEPAVEEFKKNIPLGRLGQPEDIARVAEFLASDAAGYITGQVIRVDGGMIMG
ncbi:3-oxoacyl-[acyl-carrier-protein] reductase [Candidatus Zixiibacteriota bacterium]